MTKLERDATKRGKRARAAEGSLVDPGDGPMFPTFAENVRVSKDGQTGPVSHRCFACDGTGQVCNGCGEAEGACVCMEKDFDDCTACGGSGR